MYFMFLSQCLTWRCPSYTAVLCIIILLSASSWVQGASKLKSASVGLLAQSLAEWWTFVFHKKQKRIMKHIVETSLLTEVVCIWNMMYCSPVEAPSSSRLWPVWETTLTCLVYAQEVCPVTRYICSQCRPNSPTNSSTPLLSSWCPWTKSFAATFGTLLDRPSKTAVDRCVWPASHSHRRSNEIKILIFILMVHLCIKLLLFFCYSCFKNYIVTMLSSEWTFWWSWSEIDLYDNLESPK